MLSCTRALRHPICLRLPPPSRGQRGQGVIAGGPEPRISGGPQNIPPLVEGVWPSSTRCCLERFSTLAFISW